MQDVHICEIFSSVQGEGLNMGIPALFVRFAGCNLSCTYCDTGYARSLTDTATIHDGSSRTELRNPVTVDEIAEIVLDKFGPVGTIVFTGGEPLIQVSAVCRLAGRLRMLGCKLLLETNGTLPAAFAESKDYIDYICMDIKLPSTQGGVWREREHLEFLKHLQGKNAAVKIVLTEDAGRAEFTECLGLIAGVNTHIPVLLQPAFRDRTALVSGERLIEFQRVALASLTDVRISLQLHKVLGIR